MFGYDHIIALLNHIVAQNDVITAQLSGDLAAVAKATASLSATTAGLKAAIPAAPPGPQLGAHAMATTGFQPLIDEIAKDVTVIQGATTFILGEQARIDAAVAAALAGGATAQEIADVVTAETALMAANASQLAAALTANTPNTPPVPAPQLKAALKAVPPPHHP